MILYVNGCSYAKISDGKRYSDFLGEHLKCKSINAAISGSCNSRILRTSLRDLINLKKEHDDIIAVISLSFILRTELWYNDPNRQDEWKQSGDGDFVSFRFANDHSWKEQLEKNSLKEISPQFYNYAKNWLTWFNVEAETTNLLQQVILFKTWCSFNNIKYIIFSGPLQESIDLTSPFIQPFYDTLKQDKSVIDIFINSFCEWNNTRGHIPIDNYTMQIHNRSYACGHHGEEAHRDWADFLIKEYL